MECELGSLEKKIYILCPVRYATPEEKEFLEGYVAWLDKIHKVHYPPRDTNQSDPIGTDICIENMVAIAEADEIHIYWNPDSKGSLFDFGMLFMAQKLVYLINYDKIKPTREKSFTNVLLELHARYIENLSIGK